MHEEYEEPCFNVQVKIQWFDKATTTSEQYSMTVYSV